MYQGYGIALHKVDLHNYGGRPVIYGDCDAFNDLSDERKYLWVRYRPIRQEDPGYPNDFTWEREWRCRMQNKELTPWEHSLQGVPILLPDNFRRVVKQVGPRKWKMKEGRSPAFRIIVRRDAVAKELRSYVKGLWIKPTVRGYYTVYVPAVKRAQIISLEHVERRLKVDDEHYRRIEDLTPPEKRLNIIPFPKPIMVKPRLFEEKP
ncbi:MAG TPA: hypothetical protein VKD71_05350 [Gemmataceae bacterium]|nr:hypothetical protein [Gemmataceae bacterium]